MTRPFPMLGNKMAAFGVSILLALGPCTAAQAAPSGATVTAGSATVTTGAAVTTIHQTSAKTAINWNKFGIGSGETVRFVQPSASAVALNRVLGSEASAIYGTLTANGKVFLINPNGILFAPGAQVSVGGLVASTLNLADNDFLAGKYRFSKTGSVGSVVNQASIVAADGGYVAFLGPRVQNEGVIAARLGNVGLVSGDRVTLDFNGDKLLNFSVEPAASGGSVTNSGQVLADGGTVLMSTGTKDALLSTVVNNTGLVQVRTINTAGGKILLEGSTVNVAGKLDASAPGGGNGGFIETSGATVNIDAKSSITAAAPRGKAGTWLIDPVDITVDSTMATSLQNTLKGGTNASLTTNSAGSDPGNITVVSDVSWDTGNTLTLTANGLITLNADITASGAGAGLVLSAGNGTYTLNNGAKITLSGASPTLSINGKPYTVINTLLGLQNMNNQLEGKYFLGDDLDATATGTWNSGSGFVPIGYLSPFSGTFDGGTHTITGLTIDLSKAHYGGVGLFGKTSGAAIRNVRLRGGSIKGSDSDLVGALAGQITGTTELTNCSSSATVTGGGKTGGLIGSVSGVGIKTFSKLHNSGAVTGTGDVGGIIGNMAGGQASLLNSSNTGTVSGKKNVGGLLGINDNSGNLTINQSFNTGVLTGRTTGGLVGASSGSKAVLTVNDSYNNGAVAASSDGWSVGGLVGSFAGTVVLNTSYSSGSLQVGKLSHYGGLVGIGGTDLKINYSFYDMDTAGVQSGRGGLHTAAMMSSASFKQWNQGIWTFNEGQDYPRLTANPLTGFGGSHQPASSGTNYGFSMHEAYRSARATADKGSNPARPASSGAVVRPESGGGLPITVTDGGVNRDGL